MRSVVTGLMMLVGSVVREQGQGLDDTVWRREARSGAPQEAKREEGEGEGTEEVEVTVVAGPPIGTVDLGGGSAGAVVRTSQDGRTNEWDVACTRERGGDLVFDRRSVRSLDGVTLFHWTTAEGTPGVDTTIHTAVADCRQKSIDANWPGKRRYTRAGTCGRHLVEAVCDVAPPGKQQSQAMPAQR